MPYTIDNMDLNPNEKAEEIYTYMDDLMAREITVPTSVTQEDITAHIKKACLMLIDGMIHLIKKMDQKEPSTLKLLSYWEQVKAQLLINY